MEKEHTPAMPPKIADAGFDLATVVEHAIWMLNEDARVSRTCVTTGEPYVQTCSIFVAGERPQDAFSWIAQMHHALNRHNHMQDHHPHEANATLIAAAPNMLQTLMDTLQAAEDMGTECPNAEAIRMVIAQAVNP